MSIIQNRPHPPEHIPSYLNIVSGNNQSTASRNLNPLTVRILDQNNAPISGATIQFFFSSHPDGASDYSLNHSGVTSDQNGLSSVDAILGNKTGFYLITAKIDTLSVVFTEQYVSSTAPSEISPSRMIIISGNNQTSRDGSLSKSLVVQVFDQNDNPISGSRVDFHFSQYPDGATGYSTDPIFSISNDEGKATVTANLGDRAGKYQISANSGNLSVFFSETLEATLSETIANVFENTAKAIGSFADSVANSTIAKVINKPIAFTAIIWAIIAPLIANAPIALPWLTNFINWMIGILQFGPRKRWGTVYDSVTRKAVSNVDVSVFNTQYNQLVETQRSDGRGRFIINVNPGEYHIMATAAKYSFPSEYDLAGYLGKPIKIGSGNTQVMLDIPIDPIGKSTYVRRLSFSSLGRLLSKVYYPFLIFGSLVSIAIAFNQYTTINMIALGLYVVVWTTELVKMMRNRNFGMVYDIGTRKPLDSAIVRIYDADNRKLISTKISNAMGHFNALLEPGHYMLVASKEGYTGNTKELFIRKDNYLTENIFVKPTLQTS